MLRAASSSQRVWPDVRGEGLAVDGSVDAVMGFVRGGLNACAAWSGSVISVMSAEKVGRIFELENCKRIEDFLGDWRVANFWLRQFKARRGRLKFCRALPLRAFLKFSTQYAGLLKHVAPTSKVPAPPFRHSWTLTPWLLSMRATLDH